jgi:hypothetical protein
LVVENLQVTIQEASLASEFVIRMLAASSPGKIMQLNGTDSADAGVGTRSINNKPGTMTRTSWKSTGRKCIDLPSLLFARRFSQRVIDAVLPTRTTRLEVFENVLIDPQRNQFLHTRKRDLFWRQFRNLRRCFLERCLGFGTRIVQRPRPPWWLRHHCASCRE